MGGIRTRVISKWYVCWSQEQADVLDVTLWPLIYIKNLYVRPSLLDEVRNLNLKCTSVVHLFCSALWVLSSQLQHGDTLNSALYRKQVNPFGHRHYLNPLLQIISGVKPRLFPVLIGCCCILLCCDLLGAGGAAVQRPPALRTRHLRQV